MDLQVRLAVDESRSTLCALPSVKTCSVSPALVVASPSAHPINPHLALAQADAESLEHCAKLLAAPFPLAGSKIVSLASIPRYLPLSYLRASRIH